MYSPVAKPTFTLDAGFLCLDFANTVDERPGPNRHDHLAGYADLVDFAEQAELIAGDVARRLAHWGLARPHDARAVHARAIALRESFFEVASAIASDRAPDDRDLAVLRIEAARAMNHGRLTADGDGFIWDWDAEGGHPERLFWPIATNAIDLLTSHDLTRLRICAADDCDWLFYDMTRNHSRKWCDMNTCGNRAKVARYREHGTGTKANYGL